MSRAASIVFVGLVLTAPLARAEGLSRQDALLPATPISGCAEWSSAGSPPPDPFLQRVLDYARYQVKHRVEGLASYYSSFFDGRKTANGETYRNAGYSAAHLTLPLGTWIEVTARTNGRKLRMRVNDRGPYAKKFFLDFSRAAAHYLGVDVSADRHVEIRVIALPGEEPLPEEPNAVQLAAGKS